MENLERELEAVRRPRRDDNRDRFDGREMPPRSRCVQTPLPVFALRCPAYPTGVEGSLAIMQVPVRMAAVILSLAVLAAGCATGEQITGPGARTGDASGMSCERVESFTGTLRVGISAPPRPTGMPADGTFAPGETPPAVVYPVLDSVDIVGTDEDRVMFTFSGDGSIGWSARFVAVAFRQGTDASAPVSGRCVLQVDFSGADTGEVWSGGAPVYLSPASTSEVVEVFGYPSVNHLAQTFIGTRTGTPVITVDSAPTAGTLEVAVATASR